MEEKIKEVRKADKLTAFVVVMMLVSFGAGVVATASIMQPDDSPPEYDDITVRSHDRAIAEQLNQIALTLNEIRDRESEDYEQLLIEISESLNRSEGRIAVIHSNTDRVENDLNTLISQLQQLQDLLSDKWPEDFIHAEVVMTSCIEIEYYDNFFDQHMGGTFYTFCANNWTDFITWIQNRPPGTFTQHQIDYLLLMAVNMAYYKETGTWLGE